MAGMENQSSAERDNLHRALGAFVAEFSIMVSRFRTSSALLVMGNTGGSQQWLFQVAVASQTAQPLADAFFGLISEREDFAEDDHTLSLIKKARSEINEL